MEDNAVKQILNELKSLKEEMLNMEKRIFTKIDADKQQLLNAIGSIRQSVDSLTDRRFNELERRIAELEQINKN